MVRNPSANCVGELLVRECAIGSCGTALRADWAELADHAAEPCAFSEHWFMIAALDAFGNDGIKLLEVRATTGLLVGIVALERHNRYGRIPVEHVRNWVHYQSFMGTPLVRAGVERQFWDTVLRWLDSSDWARGFLTLREMDFDGPVAQALCAARTCEIVHRYQRAMLTGELSADAYLEAHVRPKKRKELRRLAARLRDHGAVAFQSYTGEEPLDRWCDGFLVLEQGGWKGRHGAALGNSEVGRRFFHRVIEGASAAGRLDFQRLTLDGRAIAMLVNFRTPPGSWSFKIAFDEDFARYSPGVMIELENLKRVLDDPDMLWMDSCAVADHPMIDRLWADRRTIAQLTVPLSGVRRRAIHAACRTLERLSSTARRITA